MRLATGISARQQCAKPALHRLIVDPRGADGANTVRIWRRLTVITTANALPPRFLAVFS
jgi:hypothetical protein